MFYENRSAILSSLTRLGELRVVMYRSLIGTLSYDSFLLRVSPLFRPYR